MTNPSILRDCVAEEPENYAELVVSCGKFIDTWLDAGGEPTEDAVVGFYSIWSQSLDVPSGVSEAKEKADFYTWAHPQFVRYCDEVRTLIGQASREP